MFVTKVPALQFLLRSSYSWTCKSKKDGKGNATLIQTTTSFFCSLPLTNLSYCIWDKSIICFLSDKSSHPCNAILHLYCCSSVICILMYFCSQNIGYKPDILTANRPLTVTLFRPALEPGLLCVLAGFPSAFFVVSRNF